VQTIIVSEALADAAWPGKNPIGQCVRYGSDTAPCRHVVGVAENIRRESINDPNLMHYYFPIDQYEGGAAGGLFVRVRGDARTHVEEVRRALQQLMPGTSYVNVVPLSSFVSPETRSWRLGATMFVIFGTLALALAAIGLYSVIAYAVTQRQHELGVRVALGAEGGQIRALILRQGLALAAVGVALGIVASLGAGKWIEPLLYEVSPRDPVVFAGVAAVLLVTALVACLLPARRAALVDPNVTLKSD
jgi:ABC-type antimicrobial peptide transport system permease subunit